MIMIIRAINEPTKIPKLLWQSVLILVMQKLIFPVESLQKSKDIPCGLSVIPLPFHKVLVQFGANIQQVAFSLTLQTFTTPLWAFNMSFKVKFSTFFTRLYGKFNSQPKPHKFQPVKLWYHSGIKFYKERAEGNVTVMFPHILFATSRTLRHREKMY